MALKLTLSKKSHAVALIVILSLIVLIAGLFYIRHEAIQIRRKKQIDLKAIAEMKVTELKHWRNERNADATALASRAFFIERIEQWLESPGNNNLKQNLLEDLKLLQNFPSYDAAILTSVNGKLLLASGYSLDTLDTATAKKLIQTAVSQQISHADLYYCPLEKKTHYDIFVPLINAARQTIAVIILRVDPELYLYPMIQKWPTLSKTSETLIVRQDGDSVLYLNELRHQKNTALKLRISLTEKDVPAVQAVLGYQGVWQGKDYRGKTVIAIILPVENTPWFMIAKVDRNEIFEELYIFAIYTFLLMALAIAVLAAMLSFFYSYKQRNIFRNLWLYQEEFKTTLYSIGDGVIIADPQGLIKNLNAVAEKLTGWREAQAIGKNLETVFKIVNEETHQAVENPVERVIREGTVIGLANHTLLLSKDGSERPIADSGAPIRDENGEIVGVVLVFRDQTEERAAQRALQISEERHRAIVACSPIALISIDRDGKVLSWNASAERILGWSETEVIGKPLPSIPPDKQAEFTSLRAQVLAGQSFSGKEIVRQKKDGTLFHASLSAAPVYDAHGNIIQILSALEDITERKQAEEALRRRDAILSAVAEAAKQLTFSSAFEESVNNVLAKLGESTGVSRSYLFENHYDELGNLLCSQRFEWVAPGVTPQISNPELQNFPIIEGGFKRWMDKQQRNEILFGNVSDFPASEKSLLEAQNIFSIAIVPIYVAGNWWGFFGFDDCRSKRLWSTAELDALKAAAGVLGGAIQNHYADQALRESEEKYRLIVENAHDGIEISQNDRLIFCNPQFAQMLGYSIDELKGISFNSIFSEQGKKDLYERKIRRDRGEQLVPYYETTFVKKDGRLIDVDVKYEIIDYQGKPATFAIVRDITDRKQAEQQIQADLKEKTMLLTEIHHRVKNNLTVVASLLRLQSKQIKDKSVLPYFKDSIDRIHTMASVHEKLYSSKNFANINFKQYIQNLTSNLYQSSGIKDRIALQAAVQDIVLGIDDAIPLALIINELFTNAIKHAFPKGKHGTIRINFATSADGSYQLLFQDTGVGLPETIDFEKSESLGLQLIRMLAEQINGKAILERHQGTTFRINFKGYSYFKNIKKE